MEVTSFSEKQKTLIHWWERPSTRDLDGVIADGAIRSGKTVAMICGFLLWSQRNFSNKNFIIAGVTQGAVNRNVVMPMTEILRDWRWRFQHNRGLGFIRIGTNWYWIMGGGSDGAQDKLQGLTAAGAFADEAALMSEKFLNQMLGRCSVPGSKIWYNCNPEGPTHFFKTEYVDLAEQKHLLYLGFRMDDNPGLSDDTKARYARSFTGVFYKRYIKGEWVKAEGMVYPDFEKALEDDFTPDPTTVTDWCISCDYGTQNPFAALKWAKIDGIWHVVGEYYYSGRTNGHQKTDQDYVDDMERFVDGLPHGTSFIIDPSATSFIAAMRRRKLKTRHAENSVMDGIRDVATAMQLGQIKIQRGCTSLVKELQGYVWDEKCENEDKPLKVDDHACDALRYFVRTMHVVRKRDEYKSPF